MPIQVFVDDSGTKGTQQMLGFAGLIATAEQWAEFSDDWVGILAEPPKINGGFHMVRAASKPRFWPKIHKLAALISAYKLTIFVCALDMDAFAELLPLPFIRKKPVMKAARHPYTFGLNSIITAACAELHRRGSTQRFEIIFDEKPHFGPLAKAWYPVWRSGLPRELRAISPVEPMFKTDLEFVPLQAADLLAWIAGKDFAGEAHKFSEVTTILAHGGAVLSGYSQLYDRERIMRLAADLHGERIPQEQYLRLMSLLGRQESEDDL